MQAYTKKVLDWLLEDNNPPVKYLTLTNLLHKPESDPIVRNAHTARMTYQVTEKILEHRHEFSKIDSKEYWKYTGLYWQIIFLGQFLADGHDPRLKPIIDQLLLTRQWISQQGGHCLTANLLTAFMQLGYAENTVVLSEIESLAQRYMRDRGIVCTAMDYSLMPECYMALPKLLLCFTRSQDTLRSAVVSDATDHIIKTITRYEVYKYVPENKKDWSKILESAPNKNQLPAGVTVKSWVSEQRKIFIEQKGLGLYKAKNGWLKFGFPLHYNSDILETMYALARAGVKKHANLQESLQIIFSKKNNQGTWILENSLNGKMWTDVEEKKKPSKWLTYFALYVLTHFNFDG